MDGREKPPVRGSDAVPAVRATVPLWSAEVRHGRVSRREEQPGLRAERGNE
jgi:hypothetical protein